MIVYIDEGEEVLRRAQKNINILGFTAFIEIGTLDEMSLT